MDKKTFALGGLLVATTVGAIAGAVRSVKGAIAARKERIASEKELEDFMRIVTEVWPHLGVGSGDFLEDLKMVKKREGS